MLPLWGDNMSEQHGNPRTRPPSAVDIQLATILSNALVSALDALAAMHQHRPGPWLDLIEKSLVREAKGTGATIEDINLLQTVVQRVRHRLVNEAFEV